MFSDSFDNRLSRLEFSPYGVRVPSRKSIQFRESPPRVIVPERFENEPDIIKRVPVPKTTRVSRPVVINPEAPTQYFPFVAESPKSPRKFTRREAMKIATEIANIYEDITGQMLDVTQSIQVLDELLSKLKYDESLMRNSVLARRIFEYLEDLNESKASYDDFATYVVGGHVRTNVKTTYSSRSNRRRKNLM